MNEQGLAGMSRDGNDRIDDVDGVDRVGGVDGVDGGVYSVGARGFVVEGLQRGLNSVLGGAMRAPLVVDGDFGPATARAVSTYQDNLKAEGALASGTISGRAGPELFNALGLAWPDEFERCLNLTAAFEGTGFTAAVGPAQTGDSAGVTYGIIGFTSGNGELQELLARVLGSLVGSVAESQLKCMIGDGEWERMLTAIGRRAADRDFERWALVGGSVRNSIREMLASLGILPVMRDAQLAAARDRYWKLAESQARMLFERPGVRAKALLFDVAVQNGGLRGSELNALRVGAWARTDTDRFDRNDGIDRIDVGGRAGAGRGEYEGMRAVVQAVIARLEAKGRPRQIVEDVKARKGTILRGSGWVHGANYHLAAWAV